MIEKLPLKSYIYAAILLSLATIVVTVLVKSFLPPVVPIFYGRPAGEGQLFPTLALLSVPLASILITVVNSGISIYSKDIFLKKILASASFLVSVLAAIAVLKVIFLVGFF